MASTDDKINFKFTNDDNDEIQVQYEYLIQDANFMWNKKEKSRSQQVSSGKYSRGRNRYCQIS